MLSPKRTKYRKAHKGRIHGLAKGGTSLNFGAFGMKAHYTGDPRETAGTRWWIGGLHPHAHWRCRLRENVLRW